MPCIATIGFFDGVHVGHQDLFRSLLSEASKRSLQPLIYTFSEHPKQVLSGVSPMLLSTMDERIGLLSDYGQVKMESFRAIASMTAEQYMCRLKESDDVQCIMMGYDHRFGCDCLTDFDAYCRVAERVGITMLRADEYRYNGEHVSSSSIRRLVQTGDLVKANELLGYPYLITGYVEHGNGLGRQIGFPTANLSVLHDKLLPVSGVYLGYTDSLVSITGLRMPVAVNIGTNPTVGNTQMTVEVYIPHFAGDLYGEEVTVHLQRFVRSERRFESLEALRRQIDEDLKALG